MKRRDCQIFLRMAVLFVIVLSPILLLSLKDWRETLAFVINPSISIGWVDYGFDPPELGSAKFEASVFWGACVSKGRCFFRFVVRSLSFVIVECIHKFAGIG